MVFFLTVTKLRHFFHCCNTSIETLIFGILSNCSLFGGLGDKILDPNRGFSDKMIISRLFRGKSFFVLFLLFSQSMKKN